MAGFLRALALGAGQARAGQARGKLQAEQLIAERNRRDREQEERTSERTDRRTEAVLRHALERENTDISRQRLEHEGTRAKADLLRAQAAGVPDPDKRNVGAERWDVYRSAFKRHIAAKKDPREAARLAASESGYNATLSEMEQLLLGARAVK